jgi:hypothetical protein
MTLLGSAALIGKLPFKEALNRKNDKGITLSEITRKNWLSWFY